MLHFLGSMALCWVTFRLLDRALAAWTASDKEAERNRRFPTVRQRTAPPPLPPHVHTASDHGAPPESFARHEHTNEFVRRPNGTRKADQ